MNGFSPPLVRKGSNTLFPKLVAKIKRYNASGSDGVGLSAGPECRACPGCELAHVSCDYGQHRHDSFPLQAPACVLGPVLRSPTQWKPEALQPYIAKTVVSPLTDSQTGEEMHWVSAVTLGPSLSGPCVFPPHSLVLIRGFSGPCPSNSQGKSEMGGKEKR